MSHFKKSIIMRKYIVLLFGLFLIESCTDFLDTAPFTNKVNTNLRPSALNVDRPLPGTYSVLKPGASSIQRSFISELRSDDSSSGGCRLFRDIQPTTDPTSPQTD